MKAESYWQQFLSSGKIEDYLSYSRVNKQDYAVGRNREKQEGENPYAGSSYGDGNDLKSDAYR